MAIAREHDCPSWRMSPRPTVAATRASVLAGIGDVGAFSLQFNKIIPAAKAAW